MAVFLVTLKFLRLLTCLLGRSFGLEGIGSGTRAGTALAARFGISTSIVSRLHGLSLY